MDRMQLTTTSKADEVWTALNHGFSGDPAVCNWLLSGLDRKRALGDESGFRYWVVEQAHAVSAIAMYSTASRRLDVTPMSAAEAAGLAELVHDDVNSLVGVLGHAATAAAFAGHWTELADVGARPTDGGRVLEANALIAPPSIPQGRIRLAEMDDLELLIHWNAGFAIDTDGVAPPDPAALLTGHISARSTWLWEDANGPVAMAIRTDAVMGARRLAHVYTPPEQRGRGLAAALVAHLSEDTLAAGDRCMLHTQLSNPGSNRVYRRLGFRTISESIFYEFSA